LSKTGAHARLRPQVFPQHHFTFESDALSQAPIN
jgi:hypothetical protein